MNVIVRDTNGNTLGQKAQWLYVPEVDHRECALVDAYIRHSGLGTDTLVITLCLDDSDEDNSPEN